MLTNEHKHALRISANLMRARGCVIKNDANFYDNVAKRIENRSDQEAILDETDWVLAYDTKSDELLAAGKATFDWRESVASIKKKQYKLSL